MKTLKDVANLSKVHTSTVSRVLRGKEDLRIPKQTRERILAAAKELNYYPNQAARSLRLKKSHTIGLIVSDISNPFFARIARSIEMCSYDTGYTVIVCNTDENQDKENHFMAELLSRRIDGLIIAPVLDSVVHIKQLKEKNFPFVLIDRYFEDIETNAVFSNNEESAYEAVSYMAKLGHKRIAMIRGRKNIYTIQKRVKGYQKAVHDLNLDNDPQLIVGDGFCLEDGYDALLQVLSLSKRPTALLVTGNVITAGVLKAIIEKGFTIPDDISVIAYTDSVFAPYLVKPLTTVSHPLLEIGKCAFNLLKEHMESKTRLPYTQTIVESKLEIRDSVKEIK